MTRSSSTFALGLTTALVLVVLVAYAQARPTPAACGTRTGPPATYDHVIWIWMENHSYSQIIRNSQARYINSLAKGCGLATNYAAVAHPSLPNYIAATSGDTQGVTDNGAPSSHPLSAVSLFEQAGTAKSYQESMPSTCALTSSGTYAVRHNPAAYYTRIASACTADNLPMGTTSSGAFATAVRTNTLPRFSFVTPNLCSDMHDCSVRTGDAWLKSWVPAITAGPSYQAGRTVLFIVWDENEGSAGNKVVALTVSPYTMPGTKNATAFTHYSLLRTTEDLLGISTHLGNAASAASMRASFGL